MCVPQIVIYEVVPPTKYYGIHATKMIQLHSARFDLNKAMTPKSTKHDDSSYNKPAMA